MEGPINVAREQYEPLSEEEINAFFDDLDTDKDGSITFEELEAKLHHVHKELAPDPKKHHLIHPARRDLEKGKGHSGDGLHDFLCSLLPECQSSINRTDFVERVKTWKVPSQKQTDSKEQDDKDTAEERRMPWRRRIRAYWTVHGPVYCFMAFVVALQIAFGVWQMVMYIQNPVARAAFGWGVIVAKVAAGVLFPTLFFMLLSMSRHFSTFLRRSYIISRFINWDLSQAFHIRMSLCGLFFASLHAIGHLTGTFLTGSRAGRQDAVATALGPGAVPRPYTAYVSSLPGWTGLTALGLFWVISLMSVPFIRTKSYELFQLAHLLMFPMIGLLCAHGTAALLQTPMLGYWLAFPALLVLFERSWRLIKGFMSIPARGRILDSDTVEITCKHPQGKDWHYSAGQYVLLQVPKISWFQWHPFTISSCRGNILKVHIKLDGDWTNKLAEVLPTDEDFRVGIDGPFGAPAQRFYDYDYSIIVGGGIGITPFSAILTNLEESFLTERDPWAERRRSRSLSRPSSRRSSKVASDSEPEQMSASQLPRHGNPDRRVDFHWTVREKNQLLWFSDLLNRAIDGVYPLAKNGNLELNINTHITAKRKNISTHIFRYLLDSYRTPAAPYSALTGLKQPSHFGRPDFDAVLERHFLELVENGVREKKIGVFYCGTPIVGEILSDKCHMLTAKARAMGLRIRYDFLIEVFG
ncbi:uncharacterized protein LTR77_004809 [Saxophila tyrrhenica]|uniref:Uncharacterized protein n=1 Tax=Saxophila tyrrhenica TaxID=1690608 RepID=A0AAV9PEA4_9PEZI|nr:hypothetical protein LTR77_004809 [Saxophila tyrrhenica]